MTREPGSNLSGRPDWMDGLTEAPEPGPSRHAPKVPGRPRSPDRTAGLLAVAVALAVPQLLQGLFRSAPSLVDVVATTVLRTVPGSTARAGVEAVGKSDKPLLVTGTVLIALFLGTMVGPAARRRPAAGAVVFLGFGLLATCCAATQPSVSTAATALTALVAALAGCGTLVALLRASPPQSRSGPPVSRRRFLALGAGAAGGAVAATVGGDALRNRSIRQVRAAVTLPPAVTPAAPLTGGLQVPGITPLVTDNRNFYRIDIALDVPEIDPTSWKLAFHGMVDHPFTLSYADIEAMPLVEHVITMSCVSNDVGGPLVSTARFRGVLLADLVKRAGVHAGADQLVGRAYDGFTVGMPTATVLDGRAAMLAIGMNGEPLPAEHGFPARLVVPGLYGYVSATKWITEIELTTFAAYDSYWVQRGWSQQGPVKVESRIDVPRAYSEIKAGPRTVAGVAWAPHRGVARVQVRVDGGSWQDAVLDNGGLGADAWRQWQWQWNATAGNDHVLEVRAITADGETQTADQQPSYPNGASGYHQVEVRVT